MKPIVAGMEMMRPKAEAVATAARIGCPHMDRMGTPSVPPPIPIIALTDPMPSPSPWRRAPVGTLSVILNSTPVKPMFSATSSATTAKTAVSPSPCT